jgi:O-antigen/teichoic acid export membrane protein
MRAFGLVFFGILISQAISAVLPLILTRFLNPAEMGVIAGITAVVGVLGGIAHLRYANVINIADNEEDAIVLEKASVLISVITSLIALVVIAILDVTGLVPALKTWSPWGYVIPFWMLSSGLFAAKTEIYVFRKQYKTYAWMSILRSLLSVLFHLPIIWISGILVPMAAKVLAELAPFFYRTSKSVRSLPTIKDTLRKYRHIAIHDTPIHCMTLFSKNMIFFSIGFFFSVETLGIFSIGYKIFKIPISIVAESMRKVLERRLKDVEENHAKFIKFLTKSTIAMSLVVTLISISMIFLMKPFFALMFDARWISGADYVIALIPAMAMHLFTTSYQSAYKVRGKMKVITWSQISQSVLVVIAIAYGAYAKDPLRMVWAYSFAWALSLAIMPIHAALGGLRKTV